MPTDVIDLVHRLRNHISNPRIQSGLIKNGRLWNQLCCCMDTIEDVELAINAYRAAPKISDKGVLYLNIYGLFQALFLQQDATTNLAESLDTDIKLKEYPELVEVRKIRNDATGHPTKRNNKGETSYHFISRISLSRAGFKLMSCCGNERPTFADVEIPHLIQVQSQFISHLISSVLDKLISDDNDHKKRFSMKKLSDVFPATQEYSIEKIYEGIRRPELATLAAGHVNTIQGTITKLNKSLKDRGLELSTYDSVFYLYEDLEYSLNSLQRFFAGTGGNLPQIDRKMVEIIVFFVDHKLQELKEATDYIDKEYEIRH